MPGFRFDNPLDGKVGDVDAADAVPAVAGTTQPTLWISATGDEITDPAFLSEDLKLLIATFMRKTGKRKTRRPRTLESDKHGDIGIAAHGLNLSPDDEQELCRLIRERVRGHMKRAGAGK